ncbi:unnamed protein product [Rotaria sp. Silwood2]|nr:unnamed protein product [Rotaria sp. Silwood2]CAF2949027.1 unnamed protein product [Rotaria sp. Silwood2]CAF3882889.1 unnamed protein product [Rotaria sp. Silwood2]CAF4001629.1 unnamed protein product [Rotaria sp. Silwood2]CAF4204636.1 unnamed protein product [Rotaria sp. Silwood2]
MALCVNIAFLDSALTMMFVYVFSRRNSYDRMALFVIVDLMGIIAGHIYYFLEDIFPRKQGGFRVLRTPRFLYWLFGEARHHRDENDIPLNVENEVFILC